MSDELYKAAHTILGAIQAAYVGHPDAPLRYETQIGVSVTEETDRFSDSCCDGTVVILVGQTVVRQDARTQATQGPMDQEFAVLVLRCAPSIDDSGRAPLAATVDSALKQYLADRQLILTTLRSLFRSEDFDRDDPLGLGELMESDYTNLAATQIDPSGGCGGTIVTFTVPVTEEC